MCQTPIVGGTSSAVWFDRLHDRFDEARAARPDEEVDQWYCIAGHAMRLRVIGRGLARELGRGLAHLATDRPADATDRLTVDVWSVEETGIGGLVPAPGDDVPPARGIEAAVTLVSGGGRHLRHVTADSVLWLDRQVNHVAGWFTGSDRLTSYERGRPLQPVLRQWGLDSGLHLTHAGMVEWSDRGVLFGGPSGSGKSTSALACFLGGFNYLSDDCLLLTEEDNAFVGSSLYNSVHLHAEHLVRFPSLRSHAVLPRLPVDEKAVAFLRETGRGGVATEATIDAVVLPRVSAGMSTVARLSPGRALVALAPSSLFMGLGDWQASLDRLGRLVSSVPTWSLALGEDVDAVPDLVRTLLKDSA